MIVISSNQRAFTLIELLIVLAIITLLVIGILVAGGASRNSAEDRSTAGQFGLIRLEAEKSYRENQRLFDTVCADTAGLRSAIDTLSERCVDGPDGYAMEVMLKDGNYYCMDTTGEPIQTTGTTIDSTGDCRAPTSPLAQADCTCG